MKAVREVAEIREAGLQLADHLGQIRPGRLGNVAVRREPELQPQRHGHEPLLRAVVEVVLDLPPRPVRGLDDPRTGRAHLRELRLDELALALRLLGRAPRGHIEDGAVEPAPPVTCLLGLAALEHPAHGAVGPDDAVLDRERPACGNAIEHGALDSRTIVRVDQGWRTSGHGCR